MLAAAVPTRRCPVCGSTVPELLSPSGHRRRGRPRVFCSERCRLGDRRATSAPDPRPRADQVAEFAAAVRAAVDARGLSLRELAATLASAYPALASSVATLSAWQTGTSAPPWTPNGRDRVLALERCLRLPVGELALRMPLGAAVPAPRPPADSADGLDARRLRLDHRLAALAGPQQVLPMTVSQEVRLGPGHRPLLLRASLRIRAAHDGVDRFWFVDCADPRTRSLIGATSGCRVGRRVPELRHPSAPGARLTAVELVLDDPLARGEVHELSFAVRYEPGSRRPGLPLFRHLLDRPAERLDLSVRFDPRSEPAEMLACWWRRRDGVEMCRRPVTEPGRRTYRLSIDDPVPGGYGWRWVPAPVRLPAQRRRASTAA
ncbi:MAG TPA: hypothetical protein VLM05_19415 [Mycobacteriales bacterium]|nr:hypothetical protein [Mycobacteriales bacterium]